MVEFTLIKLRRADRELNSSGTNKLQPKPIDSPQATDWDQDLAISTFVEHLLKSGRRLLHFC